MSVSMKDWNKIEKEALKFFKDILKIDTTNPPGNEIKAVNYIKKLLNAEGIKTKVIRSDKNRGNLYARLKGKGNKPPIILTSHLDVVPANPDEWSHHPFKAEEDNGFIYARGALDMKHMTAYTVMSFLLLKRLGISLNRDVILLAVADEEKGSGKGMLYLVENHANLIDDAEFAFNEFGGFTLHINNKRFYPVQVAEKGYLWVRISIKGTGGHASIPHNENPMYLLPELFDFLKRYSKPLIPTKPAVMFIDSTSEAFSGITKVIFSLLKNRFLGNLVLKALPKDKSAFFNAILHNTITPTMVEGSNAQNVIPSVVSLYCDIRLLPGYDPDNYLFQLERALNKRFGDKVSVEKISNGFPLFFDPDEEIFPVIKDEVERADEGARVIPYMISGFTDANALAKLGIKTYGFSPVKLPKDLNFSNLIHGVDERIPIDGFLWGLKVFFNVINRIVSGG